MGGKCEKQKANDMPVRVFHLLMLAMQQVAGTKK